MKAASICRALVYCGICLVGCLVGCEDLENSIGEDPYGGGKQIYGLKLLGVDPVPSHGFPGDTVVFKAEGLLDYCNPASGEYAFKFYLGESEADILSATDTTLTVVVPDECVSSTTYMVMDNQVFYGPYFPIEGNISVDKSWKLSSDRLDGTVYGASRQFGHPENLYLVGGFTVLSSYNHLGIGHVNSKGEVTRWSWNDYDIDYGLRYTASDLIKPYINSISSFEDGRMLISGMFSAFEVRNENGSLYKLKDRVNVNNIMVLNKNAYPDTTRQYAFEDAGRDNNGNPIRYQLSRLNGGCLQPIVRSFVTSGQQIVAVGNLTQYVCNEYASAYQDSKQVATPVADAFRMNSVGELDKDYRSLEGSSQYTGAEGGNIMDACIDSYDGVVLVGDFSSFDGVPVPGIVRLDADGNVDKAFLEKMGAGPDGNVYKISYNKTLDKMVIVGGFTEFNGLPCHKMAMLDSDGTLDEVFKAREMKGGSPNFAQILDGGKVIVSGTFSSYGGAPRLGFLILDRDGAAQQKFNVPGAFNGQLHQVVETVTTVGSSGLLLMGDFNRFNGEKANNVLMLEVDWEN